MKSLNNSLISPESHFESVEFRRLNKPPKQDFDESVLEEYDFPHRDGDGENKRSEINKENRTKFVAFVKELSTLYHTSVNTGDFNEILLTLDNIDTDKEFDKFIGYGVAGRKLVFSKRGSSDHAKVVHTIHERFLAKFKGQHGEDYINFVKQKNQEPLPNHLKFYKEDPNYVKEYLEYKRKNFERRLKERDIQKEKILEETEPFIKKIRQQKHDLLWALGQTKVVIENVTQKEQIEEGSYTSGGYKMKYHKTYLDFVTAEGNLLKSYTDLTNTGRINLVSSDVRDGINVTWEEADAEKISDNVFLDNNYESGDGNGYYPSRYNPKTKSLEVRLVKPSITNDQQELSQVADRFVDFTMITEYEDARTNPEHNDFDLQGLIQNFYQGFSAFDYGEMVTYFNRWERAQIYAAHMVCQPEIARGIARKAFLENPEKRTLFWAQGERSLDNLKAKIGPSNMLTFMEAVIDSLDEIPCKNHILIKNPKDERFMIFENETYENANGFSKFMWRREKDMGFTREFTNFVRGNLVDYKNKISAEVFAVR